MCLHLRERFCFYEHLSKDAPKVTDHWQSISYVNPVQNVESNDPVQSITEHRPHQIALVPRWNSQWSSPMFLFQWLWFDSSMFDCTLASTVDQPSDMSNNLYLNLPRFKSPKITNWKDRNIHLSWEVTVCDWTFSVNVDGNCLCGDIVAALVMDIKNDQVLVRTSVTFDFPALPQLLDTVNSSKTESMSFFLLKNQTS